MTFVQNLQLTNFRNFENLNLVFDKNIILVIGPNGSGKTNLLESISCITPGRGLRGSSNHDICKIGTNFWHINALVETNVGISQLHLEYDHIHHKKTLFFNEKKINLNELAGLTSSIWVTPQMDGLFTLSASERRRFLDRLTLGLNPEHASFVIQYEKYQKERLNILTHNISNDSWLSIIESDMAKLSVTIIKNRLHTIQKLNNNMDQIDPIFPRALIALESPLLEIIDDQELIRNKLQYFRNLDRESGRTNFGANKADFNTYYNNEKEIPAALASTGQQKSLLISILMAYQNILSKAQDHKSVLLLDEIFVHLDKAKREVLGNFLSNYKGQIFITSTESETDSLLKDSSIIQFGIN